MSVPLTPRACGQVPSNQVLVPNQRTQARGFMNYLIPNKECTTWHTSEGISCQVSTMSFITFLRLFGLHQTECRDL